MAGMSGGETSKTETMSVTEGDAVTLQSDLSEILNDDTILWMFGPKDSLISQIRRKDDLTSFFVTDDVKFRGRLQVDQKTGSLTIRNTRTRHSGQYKITISSEKTTIKIFHVTVLAVVGKTDGVKSVSLSVMKGDPVTLRADSEIHQDALMLWRFGDKGILLAKIDIETNESLLNDADEGFKDRLQLNDRTGSLTIKNTRTTDSGLYELQIKGSESLYRFLVSITDSGLSSSVIAGIVSGVISVLLILIACVIYYRHRISKLKGQMVEEKIEKVMEGESLTLHTGLTETVGHVTIKWCYETEDNLIAEIKRGTTRKQEGADGRFKGKLKLDDQTGDLTICNIRTIHSGLYKLKISSIIGTKYKRFIVTVNVKSLSVTAGGFVYLQTHAEIQNDDLILWTLGADNVLIVKKDSQSATVNERFRGRLRLGKKTASLTMTDLTNTDSGHFKLQIINSKKTIFRRINVTVTGSTGNQLSELETAVMLLSDDVDGVNEQEETWSLS
ncbi:uncharacterized protein LOC127988122 [Carassius gibelio]|uniref:uncharacterized protein LOC127988122 n=1 Tax=Carassius gibelio TaxID=101364 RepID=UPI002279B65B|nr:uncharacterized protein LOC127988122 [Carassius gibelio]